MRTGCASSMVLGALLAALIGVRAAWAGPPTEQLRSAVDRVIGIVTDRQLSEAARVRAIRAIANRMFDFRETTRRALGFNWRGLTDAQRAEKPGPGAHPQPAG